MVKPSVHSVLLSVAITLLAIACAFMEALETAFLITSGLAAAVWLLDLVYVRRCSDFRVDRRVNKNLPIYVWAEITLRLQHAHNRTIPLLAHDYHPPHFLVEGQPRRLLLAPNTRAEIKYRIKPQRRGDAEFSGLDLMLTSPFRLWQRRLHIDLPARVRVYPNFAEIAHYSLLAIDNQLGQVGIRRRQRRGEGQNFLHLREYRIGDSIKRIDWKATSRCRKLISREYQDERDQQIIFLIDCGRRMRHRENGRAHLDQALNAMLLLSYVAIRQGDAVGFLSFAGKERWAPPRKGPQVVNDLLLRIYDLPSTTETADYVGVAHKLAGLQKRRALLVILTNTRDEDLSDLNRAARLLSRRHLLVVADLREPELDRINRAQIAGLDAALLYHGVQDYLYRRRRGHEGLNDSGAICMDTCAQELPIRLINRYLAIKRSGRL